MTPGLDKGIFEEFEEIEWFGYPEQLIPECIEKHVPLQIQKNAEEFEKFEKAQWEILQSKKNQQENESFDYSC